MAEPSTPPNSVYIRNVRYVPFLEIAEYGLIAFPIFLAIFRSVLVLRYGVNGDWIPASFYGQVCGSLLLVPLLFGVWWLAKRRVGRWLELEPDALYYRRGCSTLHATQVRRLVYLPDPLQDYADDEVQHVTLVHIDSCKGRRYRFFCSPADLEHLSTWANANDVTVDDQRERGTNEPTI